MLRTLGLTLPYKVKKKKKNLIFKNTNASELPARISIANWLAPPFLSTNICNRIDSIDSLTKNKKKNNFYRKAC